jgi:hypothetical protein
MRSSLVPLATFTLLAFVGTAAATPVHQWSYRFGSTNPDTPTGLAVAPDGDVIVTGIFGLTVDFGGGPLALPFLGLFVARYDAYGAHQWSKAFDAVSNAVTADGLGNVIITGYDAGPTDFGGGTLPQIGSSDVFIVKFDPDGEHVWSRRHGGSVSSTFGYAIAADASGNIVVAGHFTGAISLGGGELTSAGRKDIFVVMYDANGVHQWSKKFGGSLDDSAWGIDIDAAGNVVMTGEFRSSINFGGTTLVSAGISDIFLVRFSSTGAHQWSERFGGSGQDYGRAVAVDAAGNVCSTGQFWGTLDFGGGPLTSAGSSDIYLAKHDTNGAHAWSKRFGSSSPWEIGNAVATDGAGNVALTGQFRGTVDFGGGEVTSANIQDAFVAEYDADGEYQWSRALTGPGDGESGFGIGQDAAGDVFVAGAFQQTVDFGGGPYTSAGFDDIFVAKYGEQSPVPVLFTHFNATARDGRIHVEWDLRSNEGLDTYLLHRRSDGDAHPRVIATGDAQTTREVVDTTAEPGVLYYFELEIRTTEGNTFRSQVATATVNAIRTSVGPNYPNPFNPQTTIEYALGAPADVTIEIVDVTGAVVARLEQGVRNVGTHRTVWNGRDSSGRPVGSGVFFYRMRGVAGAGTGKLVLVK